MSRVLVIGCGGVASVAIQKCVLQAAQRKNVMHSWKN